MYYDLRTYTARPGTVKRQLELYAEHGFDVQRRHLGDPVVFLVTESGPLNSYVHLWAFESAAHREKLRKALPKCNVYREAK